MIQLKDMRSEAGAKQSVQIEGSDRRRGRFVHAKRHLTPTLAVSGLHCGARTVVKDHALALSSANKVLRLRRTFARITSRFPWRGLIDGDSDEATKADG
jgi:hypothetical protein